MSLLDKYQNSNHVLNPDPYTATIATEGSALLPEVTDPNQPPHTSLSPTTPPTPYLPFVE